MSLLEGTADIVYVARMSGTVTREEVDTILRGVEAAHRRLKRSVVYIGINSEDAVTPPADMRKYILEKSETLLEHASSLEIVLEGSGIGTSLLRTVVRGMVTVGRGRRGGERRSYIHATVREALERVSSQLGAPVDEVYRQLVAQRLAPEEGLRSVRSGVR